MPRPPYDMLPPGDVTNQTPGRTFMSTVKTVDVTIDVISVESSSSSKEIYACIAKTIDVDGAIATAETFDVDGVIATAETIDVDGAISSHVPESVPAARVGDSPAMTEINFNPEASILFGMCAGSNQ